MRMRVHRLLAPAPLPVADFQDKWKVLSSAARSAKMVEATCLAAERLFDACCKTGMAILGKPTWQVYSDDKFQSNLDKHVQSGEILAQAALQAELLVCKVVGLEPKPFLGRGQFPRFIHSTILPSCNIDTKFVSPAANWWAALANSLHTLCKWRSNNIEQHHLALEAHKIIRKLLDTICLSSMVFPSKHEMVHINSSSWLGDDPFVFTAYGGFSLEELLKEPNNYSDVCINYVADKAQINHCTAISIFSNASHSAWRKFALKQFGVGAGVLHKFCNAANSLQAVPLYDPATPIPKRVCEAERVLDLKADKWAKFWNNPAQIGSTTSSSFDTFAS